MNIPPIILIYFFYGLAFFSMGLLVAIEGGRAPDPRLRKALRPLAGFGLVHATHEWFEMFENIAKALGYVEEPILNAIRLAVLAFSFVSLAAFGSYLLATSEVAQRLILLVPLGLEAVWVFGLFVLRGQFPVMAIWDVADVWTRYSLAIPSALLAAVGLIVQQRVFRRAGLVRFGQDTLWAAVAFGWYGLVGQIFTRASALPPSNVINQNLFVSLFGFPIQLFRALMAILAAVFVIRFLRAFQVETDRKIVELQAARLHEAQQREALRGELFKRVVAAQEAERQRIARELHDETVQALTAIGLGLRGLSSSLPVKKSGRAVETLRHLESLIAHSLDELQRLIADLRPSHLDDLGLPAALRWYAGTIQERTQLRVNVETSGEEREVLPAVKIALFRVVQEALTNILKHAEASQANIHLSYEPDLVWIQIQDDGCGFDVDRIMMDHRHLGAWGLAGMQERTTLIGGTFSLRSRPGAGTAIKYLSPIRQKG